MDASEIEIVKKIHSFFKRKGMSLSVAESCTGGLVGHLLTNRPGASAFFDSSAVCYSIDAKQDYLGLKTPIIKKHGVISEEAARAMARGIRQRRKTDFSLATTGNLGPAAMENKAAGLVYIAADSDKGTVSTALMLEGGREAVKRRAAIESLCFLFSCIKGCK